jgi:hypothetical protein
LLFNSSIADWPSFNDTVIFRGTMTDLDNQSVRIRLYDNNTLFKTLLSEKFVQLKGILKSEKIKTDVLLVDKKTEEKYFSTIEGLVYIDHKMKYQQTGDTVVLYSKKRYLCLNIMRVENIRPAETRGIVDSFIQVEWVNIY